VAHVHIPSQLRDLTDGVAKVEVEGSNVRRVIESLDAKFPGMYARLVRDNKLVPAIAVSIDGAVTALGLLGKIGPDSEVHIVPAISGG